MHLTRRMFAGGALASLAAAQVSRKKSMQELLAKYTTFKLETDLTQLTEKERAMLPLFKDAARTMDHLFWLQAYGEPEPFLKSLRDSQMRRFAEINYGPWDRLDDNRPFVPGVGPKPAGANFYPKDMTKEEFEKAAAADARLKDLYTVVKRNGKSLEAVGYSQVHSTELKKASDLLRSASRLAEDAGLRKYLELRADALTTDKYQASDLAWMDMKTNGLDLVIGPIETYEDHLFGYKAAFEAYVLVKDKAWSQRLARYTSMLGQLQEGLPVPAEYKRESPGSDSDLNAYDVLYYAGDCNAGSKTIAINLPNDEEVQLKKGTRRLQLKNAMRAKFEKILMPIARQLIAPEQLKNVQFDAFFANVMFHEVAHGLGIKTTLDGKNKVRQAMKDQASTLEEGKADILGLYMVTKLQESELMDNYVTFLAGLFRSVRFGGASAHGRANLVCFRYFEEFGAFTREPSGKYKVEFPRMRKAVDSLSEKIIRLQGDGDYDAASKFVAQMGATQPTLQKDLGSLSALSIPVDIVFEQ